MISGGFIYLPHPAVSVNTALKGGVVSVLATGKICILDVEMEGVKSIHAITPPLYTQYILIRPPSVEALEKRLRDRGTETNETIAKRVERAKKDIEFSESEAGRNLFHKVIINDDLDVAYKELESALRPAL
ncbi:hypothetical protein AHF37_06585 [Paragonimus kellicotti]|nr:hypothetical protein AHF37_06585 [Paragonimus kellicotti]